MFVFLFICLLKTYVVNITDEAKQRVSVFFTIVAGFTCTSHLKEKPKVDLRLELAGLVTMTTDTGNLPLLRHMAQKPKPSDSKYGALLTELFRMAGSKTDVGFSKPILKLLHSFYKVVNAIGCLMSDDKGCVGKHTLDSYIIDSLL